MLITTTQLIFCSLLLGALQWFLSLWIKIRLEESIRHEYAKKIEDYKFSQLQRHKAELIAKFFAKWIKFRGKEGDFLNKLEQIEHYEELNRMSLELSLWIKDEELLKEIMFLFQNKEGSSDVRTLTGKIRKLILENNDDKFDSQEIIIWPGSAAAASLFDNKEK